jgi:hypothetical protein
MARGKKCGACNGQGRYEVSKNGQDEDRTPEYATCGVCSGTGIIGDDD